MPRIDPLSAAPTPAAPALRFPGPGAAPGPAVAARLLDGFGLWVHGEPLPELPGGKAAALLKLLLLQRRRPLPRARLCALFWPDADEAAARNSLNVTMHRLRRLLGPDIRVQLGDDGYRLVVPGGLELDTETFERLAVDGAQAEAEGHAERALSAYEQAARLYQSDLLPDIDACAVLGTAAQTLRDQRVQVLTRLAALREAAGNLHGALCAALRLLEQDPCNEAAHRQVMRCYARLDQPQAVERQYRRCLHTLHAQLGLGPADETVRCYRALCERVAA